MLCVFFLDPQAYFLLYSPSKKELLIIYHFAKFMFQIFLARSCEDRGIG